MRTKHTLIMQHPVREEFAKLDICKEALAHGVAVVDT